MANYPLRNIDPGLWKKVKVRAAEEEITIRELILTSIADYLKKDKSKKIYLPIR